MPDDLYERACIPRSRPETVINFSHAIAGFGEHILGGGILLLELGAEWILRPQCAGAQSRGDEKGRGFHFSYILLPRFSQRLCLFVPPPT